MGERGGWRVSEGVCDGEECTYISYSTKIEGLNFANSCF